MDQLPRLLRIAFIHDPHLGPCLVKWDLAHDALRIFVEHAGVDACLREQAQHEVRIGERRRAIDFQHLKQGLDFCLLPAFPRINPFARPGAAA